MKPPRIERERGRKCIKEKLSGDGERERERVYMCILEC